MPLDPSIPHADITYRIIGCAMRVQSRLGPGLREKHYQRALTAEMRKEGFHVSEEHKVRVCDGDVWIGNLYLDHLVEHCVVVEDKAFSHMLTDEEEWQVLSYLGATKLQVGLIQFWAQAIAVRTQTSAQRRTRMAQAHSPLHLASQRLGSRSIT